MNGVSLHVTIFTPPEPGNFPPVIMVPGLLSVKDNFSNLLPGLTRYFTVYYLETREKISSICPEGSVFSIQNMADDLNEALTQLGLHKQKYLILGFSMGATVVMESLSAGTGLPAGIVLVGPSSSFDFPVWSLRLAKVAAPFYPVIKPLLKVYIKNFRMNHQDDPEMYSIQSRVLDSADPEKLCATIQEIASFSLWEHLPVIHCPLIIIGASKDIFHRQDDALRLSKLFRNSVYIDLETNQRSHGLEVVDILKGILAS